MTEKEKAGGAVGNDAHIVPKAWTGDGARPPPFDAEEDLTDDHPPDAT